MGPRVAFLLCWYFFAVTSFAAESSGQAHNFIEVWLDPPKAAVGEHMTLKVMIGVDSYFFGPTDLALPGIEHALVLQEQPAINGGKNVDGTYYTTQTHQIDIYPSRAGIMTVPSFTATITQALDVDGALDNQSVRLDSEQLLGLVQLPAAMAGDTGFMVSPAVQITDDWQGTKDEEYQVGDVLTRVVTVAASEMTAMNMPQFTPRAPYGVSATLAEPTLSTNSGREDTAARIEQHMSYAIETPGRYQLGGEVLSWWDPVESARVDYPFAELPVNAGGLPWRLVILVCVVLAVLLVIALSVRRYLQRRDTVELAIKQRLHSADAGERLAAVYAYADYHRPLAEEPVRLCTLLVSSRELVDKVLAARFSATANDEAPSHAQSKALYRRIRKVYSSSS